MSESDVHCKVANTEDKGGYAVLGIQPELKIA
jgi:hypothetical protein